MSWFCRKPRDPFKEFMDGLEPKVAPKVHAVEADPDAVWYDVRRMAYHTADRKLYSEDLWGLEVLKAYRRDRMVVSSMKKHDLEGM